MNWVRKLGVSLVVAFFGIACGAVLLFNWSALGWKAYSVPTGSMRPGMPPGSLVLVHRVPVSSLKVGDVITYANLQKPGTTITHRIIGSYKVGGLVPAFRTKGDANPSADPFTVVGGQVLGRAVWHAPDVGRWLEWSKSWAGLIVLVYLPAFLIMFGEAQNLADYLKKFQVYELKFEPRLRRWRVGRKTAAAAFSVLVFVLILGAIAGPVQALLRSNTVSLTNNIISVAAGGGSSGGGSHCSNNNDVNVTNINQQNANTGNASSTNNTTGGSATSGNASNNSSTSTTITITNNCH